MLSPKVTEIPSLRIPVEIRPAVISDRHPRVPRRDVPRVMPCDCEDYPCCGHGDDDPTSRYGDMTDAEIKQAVYDLMADYDYDQDHPRGYDS